MDPLLTEFDENHRFGRFLSKLPLVRSLLPSQSDLRGFRLASTFFYMALTASVLSVLCDAAIFKVRLLTVGAGNPTTITVSFGYLYELNAAFLYLFLAPIFVFVGIRFIRNAQLALNGLAAQGLLTANPHYRAALPAFVVVWRRSLRNVRLGFKRLTGHSFLKSHSDYRPDEHGSEDPLAIIGGINRHFFRPAFLVVILLVATTIIVGTEFNPFGGDYWNLALGYVQAKTIPGYKGKTVAALGRKVNRLPGIPMDDPNWKEHWTIDTIEQGGAESGPEKVIYWIFVVFALGIQVLFVPFVIWIFFKSVFVLRLIYKAICPNSRCQLAIRLDFEDENEAFGLSDLYRAYNYLVAIIFVGAAAMASVVLANVAKGSHRIVGGEGTGPVLGSLGQGITSFLPLVVFFVLGLFLFFLRLKTEEARDLVVAKLDSRISRSRKRTRELKAKRKLVCAQTAWPDSNFKTWFGTTLPSYVFPYVFLTNKPEWAGTILDTWIGFADLFYKVFRHVANFISWVFEHLTYLRLRSR